MTTPACPCCGRALYTTELGLYACGACLRTLEGWLRELPAQLVVLAGSHQRETTTAASARVSGSRTAPLPGRLDTLNLLGPAALDVQDQADQHGPWPIAAVLGAWAHTIAGERAQAEPTGRKPEQLAAWLAPHLSWAVTRPWAPDLHQQLGDMMRTIRGITRTQPRRRPVTQPCPRCDVLALTEVDWQAYVECGECGSLFTAGDLALAARVTLAVREPGPEAGSFSVRR
ncbi:hypothetical protein ABZ820_34780 [Streptomyces diacarni]|uniref:hypothetical protein n=1 Tax=Streptomyces diacarni TaxID=2800381 RepID=UPI0033C73646